MPDATAGARQDDGVSTTGSVEVLVAVCTFRRPAQLVALLDSLVTQRLPDSVQVRVLVVDNSPGLEAETAVRAFADRAPLRVTYAAHGAGNIASGRNEALRLVPDDVDLVAFVDDDELADPDWLACLIEAQRRTSADIVTGPVLAAYPRSTPGWLQADLLYSVVGPDPGAYVEEAVTGNALVRAGLVREMGLSFDTSLGGSGGEDQLFFRSARAQGARLWFEPNAVVRETVPEDRLSLRYLLRREYRKGNTLGLLDRSRPGWPPGRPGRRAVKAVYWSLTGIFAVVAGASKRDRTAAAVGAMRVARSLGMVSGLRGSTFQHYGSAAAPPPRVLALVVPEDPAYQRAGHSHFLRGFVSHYEALGLRVVVVVTEGRLGFAARRRSSSLYRAPGLVDLAGWQVTVAPRVLLRWASWTAFRSAPRVLQHAADRVRTAARSGQSIDHNLGEELDDAQSTYLRQALQRERPHAVLFSGPFSVPRPLELPDSVRATGLICHDVVSQRAADLRAHGYRVVPADFDESRERLAMAGMSAVIAIQWDDAEVFRRMAPAKAEVLVCPVSVVGSSTASRAPRPDRCLFVGSGSLPNVDGLRWFLDFVWPGVRAQRPTAQLHVVGTVCARIGTVPPGVVLLGEVDQLAPEYAAASIVIVPLRTGSGLKVKIVEALVHGAAVVTTTVGAQGLSGLHPIPFLVTDDAQMFAAHVARVLGDDSLRAELERSAAAGAARFSPEAAFAELDHHLRDRGVLEPDAVQRSPAPSLGS